MAPPVDVPELVTVQDLAGRLQGDPPAAPVTSAEIWRCWEEIAALPPAKRARLADDRLLSSPTFEPDAGQLTQVLKCLTAWADHHVWLLVGVGDAAWRLRMSPTAVTCDYAVPCQTRPLVRRRLVGVAGCCRKSKHVGADASSIVAFAADTRIEFQTPTADIVFAVNEHDLKGGAFPLRA